MERSRHLFALMVLLATFGACGKERLDDGVAGDDAVGTKVNFDLDEVPYNTLSEYGFFEGKLGTMRPVADLLPFEPITPLFTDEAHKTERMQRILHREERDSLRRTMRNRGIVVPRLPVDELGRLRP